MCGKNTPRNSFDIYIYTYIKATRKFTAFLRHTAQSVFIFIKMPFIS